MSKRESFEEISEEDLVEAQGGCPHPCGGGRCGSTVVVAPQSGYSLSTQIPGAPYVVQTQTTTWPSGSWGGWASFFRW